MKRMVLTLVLLSLFIVNNTFAASPKTYSHLPLKLRDFLISELEQPKNKIKSEMYGSVYVEFFVNENQQIKVTGLSSNNLALGEFLKQEFTQMPEIDFCCETGKVYQIKLLLFYP